MSHKFYMAINTDIYQRLKLLVDYFGGVTRFAQEIDQKYNTILGYLKPSGNDKVKVSLLYTILGRYPQINPAWLLMGEGDMLGSDERQASISPDETNTSLTPAQREMLTYKRTMLELGASPERIIDGIEAIAMGKTTHPKSGTVYSTAEPPANPGYHKVHEPGADFGKDI